MNISDNEFEQRVRTSLDSGVRGLDGETRGRLAAIRTHALEHKPFWKRWLSFDSWIPVTAFASIVVLAVTFVFIPSHRDAPVQVALQDADVVLEVLFNENEHEDVGDPDFYVWLDVTMMEDEEPSNAG
jgi:hypothetical protein